MLEVQFSHDESGWSNVIVIVVILEAIWLIKCYQYCYCIGSNLACQMLLLLEAILLIKCYCYWKQSGWSNVYRWRWFWTQWAGISQTRLCYTSLTLSTRATESHRSSATQCTNFYQTPPLVWEPGHCCNGKGVSVAGHRKWLLIEELVNLSKRKQLENWSRAENPTTKCFKTGNSVVGLVCPRGEDQISGPSER